MISKNASVERTCIIANHWDISLYLYNYDPDQKIISIILKDYMKKKIDG